MEDAVTANQEACKDDESSPEYENQDHDQPLPPITPPLIVPQDDHDATYLASSRSIDQGPSADDNGVPPMLSTRLSPHEDNQSHSQGNEKNIQVYVRVRPRSATDTYPSQATPEVRTAPS
jgi:hypothetical protein